MQEIKRRTRTQQEYRTIPRSQHEKRRREQAFEGIEEYDNAVDPRTGWRFYQQQQGNLSPSSSSTNWDRGWPTRNVDRTPIRTTQLCTYRSSAHCPRRWFTHHSNTRGSRANTAKACALRCLPSTSTRSLSPTSPIFRPSSPSLSCPLELDSTTLRDSRRSGGPTKSASPTDSARGS